MKAPRGHLRLAFFDVDETLLAGKSIVEFLRYWLAHGDLAHGDLALGDLAHGNLAHADAAFRRAVGELEQVATRAGRPAANCAYYRLFAGVPHATLMEAGSRWYARHRRKPDAFVRSTAAALAAHRAAGDLVVLVSGSCRAILDPLAADVGGAEVLCTELVVGGDGRLTGEVALPMIGAAKSEAAAGLLRRLGVSPADCFAYGDHASDLDLLTAVGSPRIVGDDPVLVSWARRHGWPVLPV